MLLYALYTIGAVIALGLGLAATKPGAFRIERSTSMNAAPDRIATEITDFHRWTAWSPWEKLDPDLQRSFSGAPSGKGAVYEWQGNKKVGQGRMEITDVAPNKVTINLEFIAPWQAKNVTEFEFAPRGSATQVTWAMTGSNNYMAKVFGLFMNMDKMVGTDFEKGLAAMKQIAEQGA